MLSIKLRACASGTQNDALQYIATKNTSLINTSCMIRTNAINLGFTVLTVSTIKHISEHEDKLRLNYFGTMSENHHV